MTTNRVIQGTYADFKIVKTRNVAQMIIEIPLETAQEAINIFGVPTPSLEQWVAVAVLHSNVVQKNEDAVNAIKQAGMLCKSESFGRFLQTKFVSEVLPDQPESIADGLRKVLGIKSRTEFHENDDARIAFNRIKGEYDQWLVN